MRCPQLLTFLVCTTLALVPSALRADPIVLTVDGSGALAISKPQSDEFGPGGSLGAGVLVSLIPQLQLGLGARGILLLDSTSGGENNFREPKMGTLESLSLKLRVRPLAGADERRASGLFLEATGGGGLTGDLTRATVGGALGYGIDMGDFVMAPVARYMQVIQSKGELVSNDARIVMLGVEFAFNDRLPVLQPEALVVMEPEPEPLPDRDGDGVPDEDDLCPNVPEDIDGFEDANGCPDEDNDGDKILDVDDSCPDEAEDFDNFADEDGCPDPDNDNDGFLDADDKCPNEAEVINGNKDFDGCPDEGLITMIDDRIVLEERVLFDLERARVKRAGRPVLRAIVNLVSQHPEWLKIRIEGHADARGDKAYNQSLSQRRADNVLKELVKLGLPRGPMESVGYGATRPRDKREDPGAYKRNRRVEFVVVARTNPDLPAVDDPQELGDLGGLEGAQEPEPEATPEAKPKAEAKSEPEDPEDNAEPEVKP